MSLLRPPNIKTTSLLRLVFPSPKWYFPYDIIFDIKTTSLRPLLGSPKGGLYIGILLYLCTDKVFCGISFIKRVLACQCFSFVNVSKFVIIYF